MVMIPDRKSDPHSADELLRRLAWTRRLARSLLADDADAEDVAQDVWLAASRRPPRATEPLEPWLHTVVRNRVFNLTRERKRRRDREGRADAPAAAESAEAILARLELHKLLVDVVGQLTEPYRLVILLRHFEGLSSAEIGARENLPPGTVRGRLKTALELLREALDRRLGARAQWTLALTELCRPPASTAPAQPSSSSGLPRAARRPGNFGSARPLLGAASLGGAIAVCWWLASAPTARHHEAGSPPNEDRSTHPASGDVGNSALEAQAPRVVPARPPFAFGPPVSGRGQQPEGGLPDFGAPRLLVGRVIASGSLAKLAAPRVGRDGGLAGAVIRVAKGSPGASPLPVGEVQVLLQKSNLEPRVQVGRIGQAIVIQNHDDGDHSIRVRQGSMVLFDQAIRASSRSPTIAIPDSFDVIRLECPAHPSETAFVVPADNPSHAVTSDDGRFVLRDLPSGIYALEAVDEALGTRTLVVTVPSSAIPPVVLAFGDESIGPRRQDRPCRIATTGRGPVFEACETGGVDEAKKVMKGLLKQARIRGNKLTCDACHRNLDDWTLVDGARDRLEKLLATADLL
jgi:RNA polymerase sigma-70 factor (ECF subfamily)